MPKVTAVARRFLISSPAFAMLLLIPSAPIFAGGPTYSASVLYTLTPPPGLTGAIGGNLGGAIVGGQVAGGAQTNTLQDYSHAVVWNSAGVPTDLNPNGYLSTGTVATDGVHQVGGTSGPYVTANALLWSGTAGSVVNLNPPGYATSFARGVYGNQQVGYAATSVNGNNVAFLWNGTASSGVNLNPAGNYISAAYGTDGVQQVGQAFGSAVLWSGTAASVVDLAPTGGNYSSGTAYGLVPGQQVGAEYSLGDDSFHAMLWSGTGASYVDLNPLNYHETYAYATNGHVQVGYGTYNFGGLDALLWAGSASSFVDLGKLLPAGPGFTQSEAYSVDSAGNVFGIAVDSSGNEEAIEWKPVPEPSSLAPVAVSGLLLLRRRK